MPIVYGSSPFKEAETYLKNKVPLPTNGWEDVKAAQHDHAFTVAGANKVAIVEGFASAIQAAITDGETLDDFRKRFDRIVETQGWDYKGSRGWRSKLIYETNIRQAYNAGREAQMSEPGFAKIFPYVEYRHSGAENYREEHKRWDKLVLPIDDPWWQQHSPSNGYGCNCKKYPLSQRALRRSGKSAPDIAPDDRLKEYIDKQTGEVKQIPRGIDPGFEYTPGESAIKHKTPQFIEEWPANSQPIPMGAIKKLALPVPSKVLDSDVLEDGLSERAYIDVFLGEFAAGSDQRNQIEGVMFIDVLGEPLNINDNLFRSSDGGLKVSKDKIRHRYMKLLARSLIMPDEVWGILEPDFSRPGQYRLKRRYIRRWELEASGQAVHGFSAFEYGQGVWTGSTVFTPYRHKGKERIPEKIKYLERMREGVLLYRKEVE